jgi:diguanylate cyclase (GGDEF)-like protein
MGRDASPLGPVAEAQTPPASGPQFLPRSDPVRRHLERRLAQQRALAEFARRALRAPALDPLLAEAAALLRQFPPGSGACEPEVDEEDLAFIEAVTDVVEAAGGRLRDAEASRHAALHDPLTGLANRALIMDHLELALMRAGRRSTLAAVIFLDLDDFKRINDSLGHLAGDELLVRVAERLRTAVRPADTMGRWGGDEFVAVCDDFERVADVPVIVKRIAAAFELPFRVRDTDLSVVASIGVAVSSGIDDPAALIAAADSEMYRSKRHHGAVRRHEPETPYAPSGPLPTKQERLTLRLLDLLSSLVP